MKLHAFIRENLDELLSVDVAHGLFELMLLILLVGVLPIALVVVGRRRLRPDGQYVFWYISIKESTVPQAAKIFIPLISRRPDSWSDFFALQKLSDVPPDFLSDADRKQGDLPHDPLSNKAI